VKVLGVEGNRIKLSRKALLKEQRQKLGLPDPNAQGGPIGDVSASGEPAAPAFEDRPRRQPQPEFTERQPSSNASTITIEGGDDFDDAGSEDGGEEINFNRADGVPVSVASSGERRPAGSGQGGGGQRRRRRGRGRGPGSGGGNRGPQ